MEPGVVLGGKYRLDRPIGKGGMGEVWRARRLDLDADVAVKVMTLVAAEHETAFARFQREARAAAGLRSPHVVQIYDFGRDEATGVPFIAMELLDGESLRQRLARERVLSSAVACEVVLQIGRALARAHAAQIVHRDLKPDNVFLVAHDDQVLVKLLDFGIAKAEPKPGEELPTATGVLLGTPYYMSPEQLQSSRGVDGRTDLWSLSVIAYECLTGVRPFKAATLPELAMRIAFGRTEPPSRIAEVPLGFDEWFARGVEVDPERRFQSATELIEALRVVARETRTVGGGAPEVVVSSSQGLASDSLSSQVAAARAVGEVPSAREVSQPARRGRALLYVVAALALLALLVGRPLLDSSDSVAPPSTAAGALIPALEAPAVTPAAATPAAATPAAAMPAAATQPSVTSPAAVAEPARAEAAAAARRELNARRGAANVRRDEARADAERRAKPAQRKPSEPSATPPVDVAPARSVDAFDQQ